MTPRERQIAELVARGLVNKEIAATLNLAPATIASRLRQMYAKLGVDRRAALVQTLWVSGALVAPVDETDVVVTPKRRMM